MARTLGTVILLGTLLAGCQSGPRRLSYGHLESQAMHGEMQYSVYTPPGFSPDERLPLAVFLHGGGDDPGSFDSVRLGQALDEAIERGEVPRVVIVLPQGDLGFWANWYDGSRRYEDWVLDELVPHVAERYQTQPCPEGCHLMGVSMGGSGTLRMVLNRPGMFASATIISGPIMDTENMVNFVRNPIFTPLLPTSRIWGPAGDLDRLRRDDPYVRWRGQGDVGDMRLFLAWGTRDRGPIIEMGQTFRTHLREHGIAHDSVVYDGGHEWLSWTPVIQQALRRQLRSRSPTAAGPRTMLP